MHVSRDGWMCMDAHGRMNRGMDRRAPSWGMAAVAPATEASGYFFKLELLSFIAQPIPVSRELFVPLSRPFTLFRLLFKCSSEKPSLTLLTNMVLSLNFLHSVLSDSQINSFPCLMVYCLSPSLAGSVLHEGRGLVHHS